MGSRRVWVYDPDGSATGFPTYPWKLAPDNLKTQRQLNGMGLRPGGQDPVAQVLYYSKRRKGPAHAALYDVAKALPQLPYTEGRRRCVEAMHRAHRTCKGCGAVFDYYLPESRGRLCQPCYDEEEAQAWQTA